MSFGYDNSCATLSQEGRIYQVEYAEKAVENANTFLGVVCDDGVILASEKIRSNKTIISGSNPTIYSITPTIGMVIGGHLPDGRHLISRAKAESQSYLKTFGVPITGKVLSDRIAFYVQQHTLYWSTRPFGAAAIISSWDKEDGKHLYMVETNGNVFEYFGATHGKGRQFIKTEIEKNNFALKSRKTGDALYDVLKILIRSYEGEKETEYDLSIIYPDSNYTHQLVDRAYISDLVRRARAEIEEERKMHVDS